MSVDPIPTAGHGGAGGTFGTVDQADPDAPPTFDGEPIPLGTSDPVVREFPVGAFPTVYADMVTAVAESTQTDPAMAATVLLGCLAGAAGGRVEAQIRDGWNEPVCLFLLAIAEPGERKSGVKRAMSKPLYAAEAQLVEDSAPGRREAALKYDVDEAAFEKLKRDLARSVARKEATPDQHADVDGRARSLAELDRRPAPRIVASDATPEAIAALLAEQNGRLAVLSAEGGIFETMAGRYNNGVANIDVFLQGHAGDELRVDRKGHEPLIINAPALTVMLMVQPDVIAKIGANGTFRGRGLLARFLYARPTSDLGRRRIRPGSVPAEVSAAYSTALRSLVVGLHGWGGDPAALPFTRGADDAIANLERELEPDLGNSDLVGGLKEWKAKQAGAVARIATLMHLAEWGAEDAIRQSVDEASVEAARLVGDYFETQAVRTFATMQLDPVVSDAAYLLERIRAKVAPKAADVTRRDLHMWSSRARFKRAADLDAPIGLLVEHGYLAPWPTPQSTGGRPGSAMYRVHPSISTPTL